MDLNTLKNYNIRNGKFVCITYKSIKQLPKKYGGKTLTKITTQVVRLGCKYNNVVKVDNENEYEANKPHNKPFGEFLSGFSNLVSQKEENLYFWLFTTKNYKHRPQSKYYVDGVEITKEKAIEYGYKPSSSSTPMFVVKLENLISLGQ